MKIYHFDPNTNELLGEGEATQSPLEKGVFLIPANATALEPPKSKKGKVVAFDGGAGAWTLVDDHRGKSLFSTSTGAEKKITSLQETLNQEGFTTEKPEPFQRWNEEEKRWEDDIPALQKEKLSELRAWEAKVQEKSPAKVEGIGVVDAGARYLLNIQTLIDLCPPEGVIPFRMFDNSVRDCSLEELQKIKRAIQQKGVDLYQQKWAFEAAIAQATTRIELEAIKIQEKGE